MRHSHEFDSRRGAREASTFRFDARGFVYALAATGLLFSGTAFGIRAVDGSVAMPAFPASEAVHAAAETLLYRASALSAAVGSVFQQDAEAETRTVFEEGIGAREFPQVHVGEVPLPATTAEAFIVGDIRTGSVLAARRADATYPIASITKYMTALVAQEVFDAQFEIAVPDDSTFKKPFTALDYRIVRDGDTYQAGNALYPLLMYSSNVVAHALAREHGEAAFLGIMNGHADRLGMHATWFADPSGLSPENVSTADDLFAFMRHLYSDAPEVLAISAEAKEKKLLTRAGELRVFPNRNVFMGEPGFVGGKVGYIPEARQTYAAVFEVPVDGTTIPVAVIVLRSRDREQDTRALLEWFKQAAVVAE